MEEERLEVFDGTPFESGNRTEYIIEEPEPVEPLSIIVWCVGGVLLITLLSLLGRIILAKRKHPFESLDENGHRSRRRNNVFRIQLDAPEYSGYYNPVDTRLSEVVPEYNITQPLSVTTTGNHRPENGTQSETSGQRIYHVRMGHQSDSNESSFVTSGTSGVERTDTNLCSNSVQQTTVSSRTDLSPVPSGRIASVNGYLISPPPYQQVVSSNSRLPSVVVAREQRTPVRRFDFSL